MSKGKDFEKLAAKTKEALLVAIQKIQKREGQLKQALLKLSEMDAQVEELNKTVSDLNTEKEELVNKASEAVATVVEQSVDPVTTGGVSDSAKDAVIEAVSRVDMEAGDMIMDAIDKAENEAEVIDGDKIAAMVVDVLKYIEKKAGKATTGRITPITTKTASKGSSIEERMSAALSRISKG